MPARHAASHGLAALLGVLASGLLVGLVREYLPSLLELSHRLGRWVAGALRDLAGVHVRPELLGTALLAGILAALWGAAWAYMHRD